GVGHPGWLVVERTSTRRCGLISSRRFRVARSLRFPEMRFADAGEPHCKELADLWFRRCRSAVGVATNVGDASSHRIKRFACDRRRRRITAGFALGLHFPERGRRSSFIKTATSRDAVVPRIFALHVLHSAVARLCKKARTHVCNQRTYTVIAIVMVASGDAI